MTRQKSVISANQYRRTKVNSAAAVKSGGGPAITVGYFLCVVCLCACLSLCVYVRVSVCVPEKERVRERECVCVRVCV